MKLFPSFVVFSLLVAVSISDDLVNAKNMIKGLCAVNKKGLFGKICAENANGENITEMQDINVFAYYLPGPGGPYSL